MLNTFSGCEPGCGCRCDGKLCSCHGKVAGGHAQSEWAEYRNAYGVGADEMAAAHKAFMAGWRAAREGDRSGPLR